MSACLGDCANLYSGLPYCVLRLFNGRVKDSGAAHLGRGRLNLRRIKGGRYRNRSPMHGALANLPMRRREAYSHHIRAMTLHSLLWTE